MDHAKTRNTNIEFLRIMSIFSIMFLHMYRHASEGAIFDSGVSLNHLFLVLFGSWGLVGTFLFIIISSYFLIDSQEFKLGKLLNLVLCTSLYSVVSLCFSRAYLGDYISIKEIIKAVLSPVLDSYWYITGYIVLYMLHPILNTVINKLTTIELSRVVVAGFVLCFVYKYIYVAAPIGNVELFLSVYFGMALFKRVQGTIDYRKIYFVGRCAALIVVFLGILHMLLYSRISIVKYIYAQSISKFSPFMLVIAFALFCMCINRRPSYSKSIGLLSRAVLPVYLIHESDYMSSILWDYIFKIEVIYSKSYFAILFLGIAVLIFSICVMVDFAIRPIYGFVANKVAEYTMLIKGNIKWKNQIIK